jgi:hypothetical protein
MNNSQFRWQINQPLNAESSYRIEIPARSNTDKSCVLTLSYKIPKLMGLLNTESAIYLHLNRS